MNIMEILDFVVHENESIKIDVASLFTQIDTRLSRHSLFKGSVTIRRV